MKILTSLLALLFSSFLIAQNTVIADGKVLEQGTNYPLEYATVSFIDASGKTVTGGITDLDGNYAIEVDAGTYTVRYEFISYKTIEKPNQRLQQNTTLPNVYLSLDSESLDEVVVRAETTEVQIR